MAALTQRHEVVPFTATAFTNCFDVMNGIGPGPASSFSTDLTEGMVLKVLLANLSPLATVALVSVGIALVAFIQACMLLCMFLTKPRMGEARATWV